MRFKKPPRIGIIFGGKKLVIVRIVQKRLKRDRLLITFGVGARNPQGVFINAQGMSGIVPVRICAEKLLYIRY